MTKNADRIVEDHEKSGECDSMISQKIRTAVIITLVVAFISIPLFSYAASTRHIIDVVAPINTNANPSGLDVRPGDILIYPLTEDMFEWSDGGVVIGNPVSRTQLRRSKVEVGYSSGQSNIIEDISLDTTQYNGQETACVKLEFVENYVNVGSVNFRITIYLSVDKSRKETSQLVLEGVFENDEIEIDSSYDYIDISDGRKLTTSEYIDNIEVYLGDGVSLYTRLYTGRIYYGTATSQAKASDENILDQYPTIDYVIRLNTVNFTTSGKCVAFNDYGDYYAYSTSGVYLGTTNETLSFESLYYLANERIDMSDRSTSSSSKASGGFSSTGGNSTGPSPFSSSLDPHSGDEEVEPVEGVRNELRLEIDSVIRKAVAENNSRASLTINDLMRVTGDELLYFHEKAQAVGVSARLNVYTTDNNGRRKLGYISIDPSLAVGLVGEIHLGVNRESSLVDPIARFMGNHYQNEIIVLSLYQKGEFGFKVTVAAKVELSNLNTDNLYFYTYDKDQNTIQLIETQYSIDSNGYLIFSTEVGDEIIISSGALLRK